MRKLNAPPRELEATVAELWPKSLEPQKKQFRI